MDTLLGQLKKNCFQSLNQLGLQLDLPLIDANLRKNIFRQNDGSKDKGDFVVTFAHPDLKPWLQNLDKVGHLLVASSQSWDALPLEAFRIDAGRRGSASAVPSLLVMFLKREMAIAVLIKRGLEPVPETLKSSRLLLVTVSTINLSEWSQMRLKYITEAINNAFAEITSVKCMTRTVNEANREVNVSRMKLMYQKALPFASKPFEDSIELALDVSVFKDLVKPAVNGSQLLFSEVSDTIRIACQLEDIIDNPEESPTKVAIIVHQSALVKHQKAVLYLSAVKADAGHELLRRVHFVVVGSVAEEGDLKEYASQLTGLITTQSLAQEENAKPKVDYDQVIDLYQTCFRFMFLSISSQCDIHLDKTKHREALFIQYNNARLSALFEKHSKEYPPLHPIDELDLGSLLSLNSEWEMMFNYILTYRSLIEEVTGSNQFPVQKVPLFLSSLSRDLSVYYSKVKILIDTQPHTLPVIEARIHLLKVIHSLFGKCLRIMGVLPVEKM